MKFIVAACLACVFTLPAPGRAQSEIDRLAQAIRIPTVSYQKPRAIDSKAFADFINFLKSSYPKAFSELETETVNQFSMLLTWPGSDTTLRPVMFDSHYDVVPIEPGTEADWSHPPFAGNIAEGYLWGRGALDDKAAVIAYLEAIESLLEQGYRPARTLIFSFAHDEEIGGTEGAAAISALLQQRGVELEYFVGEGGVVVLGHPLLPDTPVALIGLAEKTYVTLNLTATGRGGHSSMPPQDSALAKLAKAVAAIHDNPFSPQLVSPVSDMFESLAPHVGGLKGFVFSNQWLTEALLVRQLEQDPVAASMVRTTSAVTMFNAGVKENVVPQQASAMVNFRLLPGDTVEALIARIRSLIADEDIRIEARAWRETPPVADKNAEGYRMLEGTIISHDADIVVAPSLLVATTDTGHYTPLSKNIYRFRAHTMPMADARSIHGTDERILVEGFRKAVPIVRSLLENVGGY